MRSDVRLDRRQFLCVTAAGIEAAGLVGSEARADDEPPERPGKPRLKEVPEARAPRSLIVTWDLAADADHYDLQLLWKKGNEEQKEVREKVTPGVKLEAVVPNRKYDITIRAGKGALKSDWSEPLRTATTLPKPPPPLAVLGDATAAGLTFGWDVTTSVVGVDAPETVRVQVGRKDGDTVKEIESNRPLKQTTTDLSKSGAARYLVALGAEIDPAYVPGGKNQSEWSDPAEVTNVAFAELRVPQVQESRLLVQSLMRGYYG